MARLSNHEPPLPDFPAGGNRRTSEPTPSGTPIETKTDKCRVAVIVLNLNRSKDTLDCVSSVTSSRFQGLRILVIDNGSTPEECTELERGLNSSAEMLAMRVNIGVAAAWNKGVLHASSAWLPEYILLLNNDTIVDESVITELVRTADDHPEGGLFGPTIVDDRFAANRDRKIDRTKGAVVPDHMLSGCALMIRASAFDGIGYFDEDYFAYGEEIDFIERARNGGWIPFRVNTVGKVHHRGSMTASTISGFEAYHRSRNSLLFAGKNLRGRRLVSFLVDYMLRYQPWGVLRDLRSSNPSHTMRCRLRGIITGGFLLFYFSVRPKGIRGRSSDR